MENNRDNALASGNKFTPEEKEKIQQFRERILPVLDPMHDEDRLLLKWLIARNFDLDKAEDMFKKHIRFIKTNGLDKITEDYIQPEIMEYFHTAFLGYDKEGSIVRMLHIGASDLRGLALATSQIDCLRHAFYVILTDGLRQRRERSNETLCDKHVYIIEFQGLSWRDVIQRIVVNRAFMLLKTYEANFPERLKVAYLVNVPSFFSFIYNWLKTVLPESIISKIEVVSKEDCHSVLTKIMDPSILPESVGGTKKDPDDDPNCPSLYAKPLGTPVPESMKPVNPLEALNNDPEAKRITVVYKSIFIVEKVISEPNAVLQWDFQTLDYDIRMGLSYKQDENSESEEIIPAHRVDSHILPESGHFTCENPGIYELIFDNTYSWMTKKELIFKVKVKMLPSNEDFDY